MSQKSDTPVMTQMAAVLRAPFSSEYNGSSRSEGKPSGRRRVFVQTESGCVLGMDLEREDNAHTVKRKLQLAFNVCTEESSLTFGDHILNNDLSAVRKDSPLLLTRNSMHRSSSTPCLSPRDGIPKQKDKSGPIEMMGSPDRFCRSNEIVKDIVEAIKNGVAPVPVHNGLGGAYYFRNSDGENVAIVKPTDEEPFAPNNPKGFTGRTLGQPGLKRSVRVGETGFREVAAYLLDYDNFANVPPTVLVKIRHSIFNVNDDVVNGCKLVKKKKVSKIASLQQFIPHDFDASDHGTSSFPVAGVHRIGILDIRIFNTDRHGGNLLVRKLDEVGRFGQVELIPIDHGLCLPESLEDPYFEWIHWPQASIPFSEDELEYIKNLNPIHDADMLRRELPMIREACLRVLMVCTIFLKEAAAFGLCLSEIGEMMSREFRSQVENPSEIELVCMEAQRMISEIELISEPSLGSHEDFQFDLDYEDSLALSPKVSALNGKLSVEIPSKGLKSGNWRSSLDKLEECTEEDEIEPVDDGPAIGRKITCRKDWDRFSDVSKLSNSLQQTGIGAKGHGGAGGSRKSSNMHWPPLTSRRSANEQLPVSTSFVKLSDMNEDDWNMFLDKFKELLHPAFANRRSITMGQKPIQRLGTSCRF
uniref:1-phosphatidylinositol 4-kinase n=1 Tax=Kalanchoe fedtschenkoi TaxID=63787 RepID=A0A7N0R865_KALFE